MRVEDRDALLQLNECVSLARSGRDNGFRYSFLMDSSDDDDQRLAVGAVSIYSGHGDDDNDDDDVCRATTRSKRDCLPSI